MDTGEMVLIRSIEEDEVCDRVGVLHTIDE